MENITIYMGVISQDNAHEDQEISLSAFLNRGLTM